MKINLKSSRTTPPTLVWGNIVFHETNLSVLSHFSHTWLFVNCSPSGSSVHGILQARILEWVAMPVSGGIFPTEGLNSSLLCFMHWQAGSLPQHHLGSPHETRPGAKNVGDCWNKGSPHRTRLCWLNYLHAEWLSKFLKPLCLSFLTCKMVTTTTIPQRIALRMKWVISY